jgi:hypothetical protein
MPMKRLLKLSFFTVAMLTSAAAFAQEQPRGMIDGSFDLKRAILSPTPIGPPSHFEPTAAEKPAAEPVTAAKPETRAVAAKPEAKPKAPSKAVASQARAQHKVATSKPGQKSAVAARKPRSNPLNAYAIDTRRQTWPCRGDGICAWTQPR